jgi:hypothetical protein
MPSSSSSSVPAKLTIVVGPTELTTISANSDDYLKHIEKLAADFNMPVAALFSSGCVKLFHGDEIPVKVREASVSPDL